MFFSNRPPTYLQWFRAARSGDVRKLEGWVQQGLPLKAAPSGEVGNPNPPGTRYVDLCNDAGQTALGVAVTTGNVDYALALLAAAPIRQEAVFHQMAGLRDSRLPLARLASALRQAGHDIEDNAGYTDTPLCNAVTANNPVVLQALLAAGANVDGPPGKRSQWTMPLVRLATTWGRAEPGPGPAAQLMLRELLAVGPDLGLADENGKSVRQHLQEAFGPGFDRPTASRATVGQELAAAPMTPSRAVSGPSR